MAQRVVSAHDVNEQGVAVCFAFNNLMTSLLIGWWRTSPDSFPIGSVLELAIGVLTFYFHRIVLVTDQKVYV